MAVPELLRGEGKFTLLIRAQELAKHTIQITANEKVFLPEYRRSITDDLVFCAKEIFLTLSEANDIHVRYDGNQYDDWARREKLQLEALRYCQRLLRLIDISYRLFHLPSGRVKYWGGLVIEVRNRVEKWHEKDAERYSFEE